jgi:hypothetical protein
MIDFWVLLTIDDETRRIPVPMGIAVDEDAVLEYVTSDDAWATGEVVSASWPSPLPPQE